MYTSFLLHKNTYHRLRRREKETKKEIERKAQKVAQERPDNLKPAPSDNAALVFLKEVTEKMGLNLNMTASMNEDSIYVDIEGKDSGTIIGKRGQTLDALQYLTGQREKERSLSLLKDLQIK